MSLIYHFLQLAIAGITIGAVYSLIALGFVTIYRCSGVVNFAQGDFVMLGALITANLLNVYFLPYPVAALLGIALTTVIGILVYDLIAARLRNASVVSVIMAMLGVSMFLQGDVLAAWGGDPQALPPFTSDTPFRLGPLSIPQQAVWIILMAVVALIGLYILNNKTVFGYKMTATATQPQAASLVGISKSSMIRWSFAISACVGAVSGLFLVAMVPMTYASGGAFGLKGFVAAVLGGWGKSTGAVVGGLALGLIETFSASIMPTGYVDAVAFLLLILILYFRPSGILNSDLVEAD